MPLLVEHPYTEHPEVVIVSRSGELRVMTTSNRLGDDVTQPNENTTFRANKQCVIPNNYLGHIVVAGNVPNEELCIEGGLREAGPVIPRCIVATDEEG